MAYYWLVNTLDRYLGSHINSSFDLAYSPLMARIVSLNFALSIFSISLNINSRSFLSKRYSIMTFVNVASFLKTCAVLGVFSKGYI